jgi:hypothetical protein
MALFSGISSFMVFLQGLNRVDFVRHARGLLAKLGG